VGVRCEKEWKAADAAKFRGQPKTFYDVPVVSCRQFCDRSPPPGPGLGTPEIPDFLAALPVFWARLASSRNIICRKVEPQL
jgi:hypothetical protein